MRHQLGLGLLSTTDVTALDTQLSGQMDALNASVTACSSLSPSDATAWAGIYGGWKAIHAQWQGIASNLNWYNINAGIQAIVVMGDLYDQMRGFAAQIPVWQQRVKLACPNYQAPPGIVVPPPPPGPNDDFFAKLTKTAQAVAIATASVALAYGIFKTFQVIDPIRKSLTEGHSK